MNPFSQKSAVVQLTDHLREQILNGAIGETMPGINQLVRELGMGTNTVLAAVAALDAEGLLEKLVGFLDRLFLEQLSRHGIQTGPYNLPDWEDSPKGLHTVLDSLFRTTPPTALLLDEPMLFVSARDHLARRLPKTPHLSGFRRAGADTDEEGVFPLKYKKSLGFRDFFVLRVVHPKGLEPLTF